MNDQPIDTHNTGNTDQVTRRIDPREAHLVTATVLITLVPHANHRHLDVIRREFAMWLSTPAGRTLFSGWQDAWNAWTGASATRPGLITYRTARCEDCSHGVSHRNISRNITRTGNPHICGTCRGTGRGSTHREAVRFAMG